MKAEQLRKSILQLAIQGKLVPQDPNDEPASVLLERIRAEKQKLIKEGKIKKDKTDSIIFKGDDNCYYEQIGKEVRNISEEIPFEIPENWCWCRFSLLTRINGGFAFKSENYTTSNEGVRVLRISDFDEFGIKNNKIVYYPYNDNLKDFLLENNDIVMCMTGGTVGKTLLILNLQESMLVNQRVADIKINSQISNVYVYNFLKSYFIKETIKGNKNSTNDNISMDLIKSFLFPLPPYNEQLQIVNKIMDFEILIAEYDKLEQQSTKLDSEIKDKLKKSILQYAIQGKLVEQDPNDEPASVLLEKIRAEKKAQLGKKYVDSYIYKGDDNCYYEKIGDSVTNITDLIPFEIPENWYWIRIGTLFQHNTGKALNSSNTNGKKMQYITTSNLYWNRFVLDKLKEMSFTDNEIEKCTIQKGDLLVCEGGDIGRAAIWSFDFSMRIQNHIHRLRSYIDVNIKFYYYLFYFYKQAGLIGGKGIGIKGLSSNALDKLLFPLPPINEQNRIVYHIEIIFSKLRDKD